MSFESQSGRTHSHRPFGRRATAGKARRGRKTPLAAQRPIRTACQEIIEALEQRQLLASNGWIVSYWADNTYAGTDGTAPAYVVQDNGSQSGGTVKDLSGNTVNDAINYTGSTNVIPPQLGLVGVPSTWTAGTAGNSFSARFDGILTAPETATYTFYPGSDDGDELIVDGQILDNSLSDSRGVTYETCPMSVQWAAGSTHQVSFLYQNGGGGWGQDLRWADSVSIGVGLTGANAPYVPISAINMPAGPIDASVQSGSGGNTIKWSGFNPSSGGTASTDAGSNLAYDLYRAPASVGGTLPAVSAFTKIASAVKGNSYTDTTAVAGQAYDYRVTSAFVALTPSGNILNTGTGLASATNGTSANSTASNDTFIGGGDGLTAQYFNSTTGDGDLTAGSSADNLTQDHAAVYARIDTQIDTDNSSATMPPGVPAAFDNNGNTNFSIRWDGYVLAPETGSYFFYPASDDNERVSVGNPTTLTGGASKMDYGASTVSTPGNTSNETVVTAGSGSGSGTAFITGTMLDFLNNGGRAVAFDQSEANTSGGAILGTEIYATAGQLIPLQMDYNQGGGGWHYSLNWAGPGFGSTPVDESGTATAENAYTLLTTPDLYAAKPEAPVISVLGGNDSALLTLQLPLSGYAGGGTDADSFNIYRSTTSGQLGTLVGTVAIPNANANSVATTYTYTDSGLTTGTTYYYTATAVAGGVQSAASAQVSTSAQAQLPASPLALAARNANGTVTVSWPAINFATNYTVYRSTNNANWTAITGTNANGITTNTYTDTSASGSSFYYYYVTAYNSAGNSTNVGSASSVYVANGDGFGVTYFPNAYAGATSSASGFHNNTTSETSSYWQDATNSLTPNPAASYSGFSGTNTYQTIDSTINFGGAYTGTTGDATRPPSTPVTFNNADATGAGHSISAEWDFTVVPQFSGQYTFFPSTDDGVQFYVDGKLLDDQSLPGSRGNTPDTVPVTNGATPPAAPPNLPGQTGNTDGEPVGVYGGAAVTWTAGSTHTIRMIWANGGGGWDAHLYWASGGNTAANPDVDYGQPYAVVPQYEAYAYVPTASQSTGAVASSSQTLAVASPNNNEAQLTWDSVQADSYLIYRTAAGAAKPTAGTVSTYGTLLTTVAATPGTNPGVPTYSYTDMGVSNGNNYYYTIVPQLASPSTAGAFVSGPATILSATPAAIIPAAPTITTTVGNLVTPETLGEASVPASNVIIAWGSVPFATSYNVLRAVVTNGTPGTYATLVSGLTTSNYTDATAAIGTVYSYEVQSVNGATTPSNIAGSTSTAGTVNLLDGVIQNYWAGTQVWGSTTTGAQNTAASATNGIYTVGNPSISSFQPHVDFVGDGNGAVAPPGGSQGSTYSVELTGQINITQGGAYTFFSSTDDYGYLFVDGSLVAAGNSSNDNTASDNYGDTVFPILLSAHTTYNFQFYQEQGAGGHQFLMYYNGPDSSGANQIVPTTVLTDQLGAAAAVTVSGSVGSSSGSSYPVTITFPDINTNEQLYMLQRSTSPTFAAGTITTVQTIGLQDNGDSASGSAGNQPTVTLTDISEPPNSTQYYRVVAVNFEGSSSSNILTEVIPAASATAGAVEAHYYSNEWWDSASQVAESNTAALTNLAAGLDSQSPLNLTANESALPADIDALGSDSGSGNVSTTNTAQQSGLLHPDPAGSIGPDNFSDVFTGVVNINAAGNYTFAANTDDDGFLYIDDKLVSSYPGGHGANNAEVNYALTLTAGTHDFQFFQSNGGGGWNFQMYYAGPDTSGASEIVPSNVLNSLSDPVVAPTTFSAVPNSNAGQVTLTWSNNNTSAIRYVIQRSTDPTFSSNVTTFDAGLNNTNADVAPYPATSTYTDTGLPTDATYYYRIYAQNFDGTSSAATATVKAPPGPPVGVEALWSGSSINVTWLADANAVSYNVYRSTAPGGEGATPIATGITTTSYTDSSVSSDLTYYYQITAVDANSLESAHSFEVKSLTSLPSTVIITELQAINNTSLADSAGGYPDWLELYNPTAATVNLNGYYLTDKAPNPTEWEFPSITLASGSYMIVFCDSASQTNPAQQLHTNFNLGGSGGYVELVGPDGHTVLSSYAFPQQLPDGTYGMAMAKTTSGGSTITSYGAVGYLNPTPGAVNGSIIGAALTPEPTFNQPGGFYTSSFQLSINDATPGAAIYYTLDGSLPSATNGTLYTGPITISGQTAMRAVAIGPDDVPSYPNSDTFIYTAQVVTQDANGQPPPGWPSSWGLSIAHYGMNPAVVNSPSYSSEIQSDLLDVPTFSLTLPLSSLFDPATGIYSNSEDYGGAFVRAASVQYILPSGAAGFTANAGLAIKGDASAASPDAMHGFRLEFSSTYGQNELDYPLFSTGTDKFEEVDLRCDQNNSWDFQSPQNYIGIRDQFSNATLAAMGVPGQRSQICYLYINGVFWGLYDAIDRTDAYWAGNTYGGSQSDYDAIKSGGEHNGFTIEATDGSLTAWDELVADTSTLNFSSNANYEMIQGNNPDGTPNPAYPDLIDVPELIQYMLVIDYTGNIDAPNSTFISNNPNNFYAVRPTDGSFGFIFMATDSEWTLLDVNTNRVNSSPSSVTDELATPAFFFQKLETNANFKQLVADDIQKDFFNNGPLSVTSATATFKSLAAEVYGPVVEQSARWGDVLSLPPYVSTAPANPYTYTRNVDWQNAINSIETSYLPQRTGIVLGQLESAGLYPSIAAPTFSQFGGTIAAGYKLSISNPNSSGSIYYTLDGSNPVTLGGTLASTAVLYTGPLTLNQTTDVQAVVLSGSTFSAVTEATFDVSINTVHVTELDYDPPTPLGGTYSGDDDEFIELKNFGTQSVNLDGVAFTNGINYTFGDVSLAPGQVGVLVSNPNAFAALYGNSIDVLGNYEASGTHFSNSGEEVTLADATGQTLADFTYSPAWYPTTAGGGPSLEVVAPASNPNLNLAASWMPSPEPGGTPGVDDSIPTGPPTGLTGAFTNQQVTLTWSAVAGAASYNVYRGTASGGEATTPIATGVTATSFIDTSAAGGNTYYYTVAAVDPGGVSTASNEVSVVVPITPYLPVISTQPASQIVKVGNTATFTASASGYPLPTVQWNMSSDGGKTWSPISGATSTTYSFTVTSAALDGTEYQAVFTNSQGSTPTSPATLSAIAPTFTAWNFDTSDKTQAAISIAANTSPDPSTGSGTASSIGMALVTGPDTSNITAATGSSDTSSTNQVWRVVGTNGWSSTAPIVSQGAQFLTSTAGYSNLSVQFDLETTAQGEGKLAVQYTTNGGSTWSLASSLYTNGAAGIAVATNTTSANTVQGEYFDVTGGDLWYNRLTADFNGVAGVANNPNFGIRLVNASTGADCVNSTGQPLDNTSGNWRFDEVDVDGTAMPVPLITTQPVSQVATVGKTVSFTAAASGTPTPTVQWQVSTNGGSTWSTIAGATSATYSFIVPSTLVDGYEYEAVFTNSLGSATSNPATLTAVAAQFTAWNFDTSDKTGKAIPAATNTSPDPSTGTGTATSIGMALVSGPDASAVLAVTGSSDTSSTNQAWKIVGTNGWSSTAPIGSQGAQFLTSTAGYSSISFQFDLDLTAQGEGKLAVEYTTNGGAAWNDATSLSANGDAGITVLDNTTSPNTIQGEYFDATGGGIWYNRLTVDFNGVAGVANNPNFGIRLVNASTGADCVNSTGQALNNTSGNWRFDEVDINGSLPAPVVATQPIGQDVTVGGTASFTAAATGTPTPTVQWEVSTNGGMSWSPITGATSTTYSFPVTSTALDGTEYEAVFTNPQGSTTSNPATLTAVAAPFTAWNFDTSDVTQAAIPAATNTDPDPSSGSGAAASIGMALVSGPDASAILVDPGSSDGGAANTTNQAWKIVGTNGWSSTAPVGSQGAQFLASTAGYGNISVQFDLDLTAQGEGNIAVEYTTNGGATWNDATSLSTDGDAGISVLNNTTSPNTIQGEYFSATGGGIWYNRLTADLNGVAGVANNPNFGIRLVNASTGADCVNSTGQALNNTSGNWRFDEVDINGQFAPTIVSVTPEDNAGNGVAAGSSARGQRSMETQIAVVFSEPVNLTSGAFTIGLANQYGSGANNGSADTLLSGVLGTPTNPSGDGVTWIIPVLSNGTNSYPLKGTNGGISGAGLDNGVYRLNVVAADVTAPASGLVMTSNYSSAYWHRLYGDVDNAGRVFNTEYSAFLAAFNSTTVANGATNYNPDLDVDGDGRVFNTDYSAFLADFGSTKVYTEPQS